MKDWKRYTDSASCSFAGVEWNLKVPRLHCGLMVVSVVPGVSAVNMSGQVNVSHHK